MAKYIPTPEELENILKRYEETKNYSLVSRETGLSVTIIKRLIVENGDPAKPKQKKSTVKNAYIYGGPTPVETELPSKAQYYHQLICLMKEHLNV